MLKSQLLKQAERTEKNFLPTLENPEILVKGERLTQLDDIVTEVKRSEEWEAVRMSILSIGLECGEKIGLEKGKAQRRSGLLTGPPFNVLFCRVILPQPLQY